MSTATSAVTGVHFEKLMEGVDEETRKSVEDGLVFFANDADTSGTAEKSRADKLRTAYNNLVDYLVVNRLNEINGQQATFLCTGALGDTVTVQAAGGKTLELLPTPFYEFLLQISTESNREALPFPVYSVMEKFTSIARGELLALTMGDERKKALRNSPQDQKRARDEQKRKMDQLKSEVAMSVNQIDTYFPKVLNSMNENALKNAKVGIEMMKKVSLAWSKGDAASAQEKALINAFEAKVGATGASMAKWVDEIIGYLAKVSEHAKLVDEKHGSVLRALAEINKIDNSSTVVTEVRGPLFNPDSISSIRTDIDTTNGVSVRTAESSPMKVAFSASRVLLNKHFGEGEDLKDRLCTPGAVSASLEKIVALHTNLFPKDFEGRFVVPYILIEPLRNFVDFFQDRFIMSLVSGEQVRKGPFVTFSPVDVQVLRLCALYLTKDPIYDYRGDVKVGTFMGDYVGKIEKTTKVKWTGQDKKFSLASTQSMQDTASRDDGINDYIDFMNAMANNIAPSPKISKRKIAILLRYVLFDKLEKNIAGILKLVAQTDPAEAKDAILSFVREDVDKAKELIREAVKFDPQASKMFSDNPDFAIMRVFGR